LADGEPLRTEPLLVPTQPVTGVVLGNRYRLLERVGRGGMADVFAAEDLLLTRRVAVKIFRFDLSTDDERRRVQAEMQTLAALHHPGLVTVFDAGTVREEDAAEELSSPYLVMELVQGPNLGQRLSEGPLSQADTAQLGTGLAATLAYVHARNVIHRDVKPANILLDSAIADDAPFASKLTDFGIARVVDSTHFTEAGFTIGTANYLSPEQALSGEVGTATDIYSLGLVLLECLTGELAYPGSGIEAALARLNRQPVIPAELGPGWQRLLGAATESDPANRPTAAELSAELRTLTADGSLPATGAIGGAGTGIAAGLGAAGLGGAAAAGGIGDGVAAAGAAQPMSAVTSSPGGAGPAGHPTGSESFPAAAAAETEMLGPVLLDPPPPRTRMHGHGGMIAAAVLVLAALLTSGYLLRAGHAGEPSGPAVPGNPASQVGQHSSVHTSVPTSVVASPVSSHSGGGSVVPPVSSTSTSATSTTPSVTRSHTSAASTPASSTATSGTASSSATSSGSATASGSASSSTPAGTGTTTSSPGNNGGGKH
jgi:eukaryotic-like serine/threonine-protein kinase